MKKNVITYVCIQLFGRIYAQGRDFQDMILVGVTSGFGNTAQQEVSWSVGIIVSRLL